MRVDPSERTVSVLKHRIEMLAAKVYTSTDDVHLKAIVGSVFDSVSVVDTIAELKGLNEGTQTGVAI